MTVELYWLTLTLLITTLFWLPYTLNRVFELGLTEALKPNVPPVAQFAWAQRMRAAHKNAIENLVIFAPLVIILQLTQTTSELTATATMVYFFARVTHYVVYTFKVPFLRTISYFIGFMCTLILALSALGVV